MARTDKEKYFQRKKDGLCVYCGKELDNEDYFGCTTCRNKRIAYRKSRVASGLCGCCGKPNDRQGKWQCSVCNKRDAEYKRNQRHERIELSYCPVCGVNKIFGSERSCYECKAKNVKHWTVQNEKRKEYRYKFIKNQRDERKSQGLCPYCGKRITDTRYVMCEMCRYKARQASNYEYKMSKDERFEKGICVFCDKPVSSGYKVCEYHLEKARTMQRHSNTKEHIWRSDNGIALGGKKNGTAKIRKG